MERTRARLLMKIASVIAPFERELPLFLFPVLFPGSRFWNYETPGRLQERPRKCVSHHSEWKSLRANPVRHVFICFLDKQERLSSASRQILFAEVILLHGYLACEIFLQQNAQMQFRGCFRICMVVYLPRDKLDFLALRL